MPSRSNPPHTYCPPLRPSVSKGTLLFENAEKRGDVVSLPLTGKGVRPTVKVTHRVVRFSACPCYERRDVVVGINNTGELPVRYALGYFLVLARIGFVRSTP